MQSQVWPRISLIRMDCQVQDTYIVFILDLYRPLVHSLLLYLSTRRTAVLYGVRARLPWPDSYLWDNPNGLPVSNTSQNGMDFFNESEWDYMVLVFTLLILPSTTTRTGYLAFSTRDIWKYFGWSGVKGLTEFFFWFDHCYSSGVHCQWRVWEKRNSPSLSCQKNDEKFIYSYELTKCNTVIKYNYFYKIFNKMM